MRKLFLFAAMTVLLGVASSCEKDGSLGGACDQPHNAAPAGLQGGWANGFTNHTQIIDVYNGDWLGNTWQSAKYFKFTANGKGAEFYYMAQGQYSKSATYVKGTIEFDEGATAESGSFTFHACQAHYKGWGSVSVDRNATDEELQNNLSGTYYYEMQGNWLRINPGSPVNEYTSSFEKID